MGNHSSGASNEKWINNRREESTKTFASVSIWENNNRQWTHIVIMSNGTEKRSQRRKVSGCVVLAIELRSVGVLYCHFLSLPPNSPLNTDNWHLVRLLSPPPHNPQSIDASSRSTCKSNRIRKDEEETIGAGNYLFSELRLL